MSRQLVWLLLAVVTLALCRLITEGEWYSVGYLAIMLLGVVATISNYLDEEKTSDE